MALERFLDHQGVGLLFLGMEVGTLIDRATQFLIQKVAIDVQRGNAASVMVTIPPSQDWAEFASLPTV